ncbi:PREDICTED: uncharacterized protein LOC104770009 [Camelina sativa]|uniref:Uncharacterized protein LOC104770009 n=1 Tax=Camelina sativa TaxID=90675 RepID=A0ABM0XY26_CAMSA|nr:PREDICTED: uncharacterized protein LOC104770009 [Camelina sativa]
MSRAKDYEDFKETFKRYDEYVDGEISWNEFGYSRLRKRSTPVTKSEINKIYVELGTRGEDRVFGEASKFPGNLLILPSLSVKPKLKDMINVTLPEKESNVVNNSDKNEKKTEDQAQNAKEPLETIEINEDWVVIEDDDDKDFELC